MIDNQDIAEALDRLARTPDGGMLYRFLQKTLMTVSQPSANDGALRQMEGRRMFASELMGHMSEGIAESDRTAITFASSAAARTSLGPRGAARRVSLDTPIAGWDGPSRSGSDAA
jgi:hypothetical protein